MLLEDGNQRHRPGSALARMDMVAIAAVDMWISA